MNDDDDDYDDANDYGWSDEREDILIYFLIELSCWITKNKYVRVINNE